jgi:DNA-binding NtrC family response regulator
VRGAFTGAHTSKTGLFEKAHGGTLFLDEIGDMGAGLQSKLLRVLQDREVRPVGGTQPVKVDVRIVAATHKDLDAEIAAGRFREDLFYRLNVIPIHIPPLRERPDDIAPLVRDFLKRHDETGRRALSQSALERLAKHSWRGNARELENTVERALALCDHDLIEAEDLPLGSPATRETTPVTAPSEPESGFLAAAAKSGISLHDLEERYIEAVLRETGGNRVQAARVLGIDRKTLYRRAERNQADG